MRQIACIQGTQKYLKILRSAYERNFLLVHFNAFRFPKGDGINMQFRCTPQNINNINATFYSLYNSFIPMTHVKFIIFIIIHFIITCNINMLKCTL